eukprot:6659-Heterococcus_DN1.PRE.3
MVYATETGLRVCMHDATALRQCCCCWSRNLSAVYAESNSCSGTQRCDAMNADALLELQNAAAMAAFTTAVMDACPHCGRTFIADRLKIHLR